MTTAATDSHGTLMQMETTAGSGTYVTIAEVRDITAPEISKTRHDATSHDSGGWTERISGIKTLGQIEFEVNWIPSNTTHDESSGLVSEVISQTDKNYRITFPDTSAEKMTFKATVANFQPLAPVDGVLRAKVKIDPTGAPTWSN